MSPLLENSSEILESRPTQLLAPSKVSPFLVMLHAPNSFAAEQYRLLAHSLESQRSPTEVQSVGITSPLEGDGKTVTALNLAFALAENRSRRVVLCDVDLRKGGISQALGLGKVPGIAEVLTENQPVVQVLKRVDKNLAILPSGGPTAHPVGLLRTAAWRQVIHSLRRYFDYILLDCPPLCLTGDIALIKDVMDRALVVVRSGGTRQEAVKEALDVLGTEKTLGFVLNASQTATEKYQRPYPSSDNSNGPEIR